MGGWREAGVKGNGVRKIWKDGGVEWKGARKIWEDGGRLESCGME